MIAAIEGQLVDLKEQCVFLKCGGVTYEVWVSASVARRLMERCEESQNPLVCLKIYHYHQMGPSVAHPILIGFLNDLEKDFFLQFIRVSGIGPRAAVKALDRPFRWIAQAIADGDVAALKQLPGIGPQKAKEIVAKLQNKVGRFGLIRDDAPAADTTGKTSGGLDKLWQKEALEILLQLQYKKQEAENMIRRAVENNPGIRSAEELLDAVYRQGRSS